MPSTTTPDAILNCARSSIITSGYNGFSYADIAAVVGIRKASIHHHFPTKADLVRTLVAQYRGEAEAGLLAISQHVPDPIDQLHSFIGYWESCIGEVETSYCLCALLATQIPVLPADIVSELRAYFKALSKWLAKVIEDGVSQGIISLTSSVEAEAETLMATIHGAMSSARAYGDATTFAAITRPAVEKLRTAGTT